MKKLILDQRQFNGHVSEICRSISISGWQPDYIVGITRGGLLPAVMISHYLDVPCETLKVSLRDGAEPESNLWMAEDAYNGKNILIVDDINDTGATFNWIINDWPESCHPNDDRWNDVWNNNVKFAVVVDNLSSKCSVYMDYWSLEVNKAEEDVWIEFPYEDWWKK